MIERQSIDGRLATIAYFGPDFAPVDKTVPGHYAKVLFDDGEMVILKSPAPTPRTLLPRQTAIDMKKLRVWQQAIAILDHSEIEVRDVIERGLSGVAAIEGTRYGDANKAVDDVMVQVGKIRTRAIKQAFRLIRDKGV